MHSALQGSGFFYLVRNGKEGIKDSNVPSKKKKKRNKRRKMIEVLYFTRLRMLVESHQPMVSSQNSFGFTESLKSIWVLDDLFLYI